MSYGTSGMHNLRNTCYMNTGLQCLTHCEALYKTLHGFSSESRPQLFSEFLEIFSSLWNTSETIVPSSFKRIFSSHFKQFAGSDQHDCQEFLSFLLDRLHEELNINRKKPLKVKLDTNIENLSENDLAEVTWNNHKSRNSSFVSDLMFGQFKSTIFCDLQHKSLVFDPFLMVSLPIARLEVRTFQFIYFKKNLKTPCFRCGFLGDTKSTVSELISFSSSIFEVPPDQVKVASSAFEFSFQEFLSDALVLDPNRVYFVYEVVSPWLLVVDQRKRKIIENHSKGPSVAYSRVVSLAGSETFEDLHRMIYSYFKKSDKGYLKDFESLVENNGKESQGLYTLMFLNPSKNSESSRCLLCQKFCKDCLIPFNISKITETFPSTQRLEVLWSKSFGENDLKSFKTAQTHPSLDSSQKSMDSVKKSGISLKKCIQEFETEEKLENSNKIFCKACEELKNGSKQMSFWRLPRVLIIHLKRFKQIKGVKVKDNQLIHFDTEGLAIRSSEEEAVYDLFAVANHYGDMNFGHYTAFALNHLTGTWLEFDDEKVAEVQPNQLVSSAAYILFYQKR